MTSITFTSSRIRGPHRPHPTLRAVLAVSLVVMGILFVATLGATVWWVGEDLSNVGKVDRLPDSPMPGTTFQRTHRTITTWVPFATLACVLPAEGLLMFLMWQAHQRFSRRRPPIKPGSPFPGPKPGTFCPKCNYDMRASPTRCPECGWSNCITLENWRWIMTTGNVRPKTPQPAGTDTLLKMHKVFVGKQ